MLSRSSSAGGFSSITVSKDVDFPLPVVPTRTTLVIDFLETPRFISSSYIFLARRLPINFRVCEGGTKEGEKEMGNVMEKVNYNMEMTSYCFVLQPLYIIHT